MPSNPIDPLYEAIEEMKREREEYINVAVNAAIKRLREEE